MVEITNAGGQVSQHLDTAEPQLLSFSSRQHVHQYSWAIFLGSLKETALSDITGIVPVKGMSKPNAWFRDIVRSPTEQCLIV